MTLGSDSFTKPSLDPIPNHRSPNLSADGKSKPTRAKGSGQEESEDIRALDPAASPLDVAIIDRAPDPKGAGKIKTMLR